MEMGFRKMRRFRQELSREECDRILKEGTSGVLAVNGDEGFPYAVPVGYVYDGESIWFHGANEGHKMDSVRRSDKVSFCIVEKDEVVPEDYSTNFRSVIVFGRAHIVEDRDEIIAAMVKLAKKYNPDDAPESRMAAIEREFAGLGVIKLTIEHMTGKESLELVREREKGEK